MTDEVVYTSKVRIERIRGSYRLAYLPVEAKPIPFGVHSQIAAHCRVDPEKNEPHAAILDYLVAAAAG